MKLIILFISILYSLQLFSQSSKESPLRGEIPAKDIDYVSFIPINQKGLIVFGHSENHKDGKDIWYIEMFDKNFNALWKTEFFCQKYLQLVEYSISGDTVLDGFFTNNRNTLITYTKIHLNLNNGEFSSYTFSGEKDFTLYEFKSFRKNNFVAGLQQPGFGAYLGQFFYNFTLYPLFTGDKIYSIKTKINFYNEFDKSQKSFLSDKKGISSIIACQTDTFREVFLCIYKNQFKKQSDYYLMQFSKNGDLLSDLKIDGINSKQILTANILQGQNGEMFLAGTFSEFESNSTQNQNVADGMFFGNIYEGKCKSIKFHRFSDFKNAVALLDFKELKKLNNKKKENKDVIISFNVLLHNKVEYYDSTFVLMAENYHPEYHNEITTDTRGYLTHQEVFDGYRYTHALVAAFDKEGNLKWDNIIEINDILVMRLQENVTFFGGKNEQALVYYCDGFVSTKVINGSQTLSQKSSEEIPTVSNNEKVIYEDFGKIYHWYGDYFLISSYQKVMDINGNKRKVFSFNKLIFE